MGISWAPRISQEDRASWEAMHGTIITQTKNGAPLPFPGDIPELEARPIVNEVCNIVQRNALYYETNQGLAVFPFHFATYLIVRFSLQTYPFELCMPGFENYIGIDINSDTVRAETVARALKHRGLGLSDLIFVNYQNRERIAVQFVLPQYANMTEDDASKGEFVMEPFISGGFPENLNGTEGSVRDNQADCGLEGQGCERDKPLGVFIGMFFLDDVLESAVNDSLTYSALDVAVWDQNSETRLLNWKGNEG
jgi:hypothetical protein